MEASIRFEENWLKEESHSSREQSSRVIGYGFRNIRLEFPLSGKRLPGRLNRRCRLRRDGWSSAADNVKPFVCLLGCLVMQRGVEDVGVDKMSILKIDKDCFVDRDWLVDYMRLIVRTCQLHGVTVLFVKMCRSRKKGFHLYIEITPAIEPELANRLQWLLGDDSARVDFNRARIRSGLNEWNKLFEEPRRRLRTIYKHTGCSLRGRYA